MLLIGYGGRWLVEGSGPGSGMSTGGLIRMRVRAGLLKAKWLPDSLLTFAVFSMARTLKLFLRYSIAEMTFAGCDFSHICGEYGG